MACFTTTDSTTGTENYGDIEMNNRTSIATIDAAYDALDAAFSAATRKSRPWTTGPLPEGVPTWEEVADIRAEWEAAVEIVFPGVLQEVGYHNGTRTYVQVQICDLPVRAAERFVLAAREAAQADACYRIRAKSGEVLGHFDTGAGRPRQVIGDYLAAVRGPETVGYWTPNGWVIASNGVTTDQLEALLALGQ